MSRPLRWYDFITINIYFLGLSTLAQTLSPLVFPLLVQQFVGEAHKAAAYGTLRLWSLMVALLAQALWGLLSDRSTLRWGRRRPFILGGTLADLVFLAAIGALAGYSGEHGFTLLCLLALGLQVTSNAAHAAQQALMPDLVPNNLRGRFAAVKALLEVPAPVLLVSFVIGRQIAAGDMWAGILVAAAVLVATMLLALLAPEQPLAVKLPPLDWQPFLRLVGMTVFFTAVILGLGALIRWLGPVLDAIPSTSLALTILGVLAGVAMIMAVALGVSFSVRLSIGLAARQRSSFTWWVISRLFFLVGVVNLSTFAVFFLQARLGMERETAAAPAAMLLLFVGLLILVFAVIGGWLADHVGRQRVVALAGLIAAAGALITISQPSLAAIYVGASVVGAGTGLFYTASWALGTIVAPENEAGRYLGISNLAGAGAGAIGAYIGGPIADYVTLRVPETPGLGYVLLFAIYGVLFLGSVVAVGKVQES